MAFFALAVGGLGFVLIGAWEALSFSSPYLSRHNQIIIQSSSTSKASPSSSSSSSSLSFLLVLLFSVLFVLNSIFSLVDAVNSRDRVGLALQLQTLAVASLFFLYAVAGLVANSAGSFRLPSSLVDSIALFAFAEEFLLFYLQRKDVSGIENRYFDLLLVPIAVCVVSTILGLKSPESNFPKLSRGVGLILQGMWFVQMALSFHTGVMAHGCSLHWKSRGNYTVKCKGHAEYHRARAIATLQFNCHLALLVVVVSSLYSAIARRNGGDFATPYRPIAAEMQAFENQNQFTLDSDEDDGEIKVEDNAAEHKAGSVELGLNGHHVSRQ